MSRPITSIVFTICYLLLPLITAAQLPDFKFHHLGIKDGFSANEMGTLFRDSRGFLWVGSFTGLNRYDGHHVVVYRHKLNDLKSLADNLTSQCVEDSLGNIWVGCGNGFASRYNFQTNSFTNFDLKSPSDTDYFHGKQTCYMYCCGNDIWALRNLEFYHFNFRSQKFIHFETAGLPNRVQPNDHFAFATRDSKIYFRTHGELMVMDADGKNVNPYFSDTASSRFFNNLIMAGMYVTESGDLWFSEWTQYQTYFYSAANNTFTDLIADKPMLASNVINMFIPYGSHQLLAASYADGLWLFDEDSKKILKYYRYDLKDPSSLSSAGVAYILLDQQGTLWLNSGTLDFYNPANHQFRFIPKDPKPNPLYELTHFSYAVEDSNHHLWFSEFVGGICEFSPDSSHLVRHAFASHTPEDANNNAIYSMMVLDRNHILAGLQNGLLKFDMTTKKLSDTIPFPGEGKILAHHTTSQMLRDKNGLLWLATARNGIVLYDEKKNTCTRLYHDSPDPKKRLPGDWITEIEADSKNNIWITAKEFDGLTEINPDSMIIHAKPFPQNYFQKTSAGLLYNMLIDGDSVIWLGAFQYGLIKYYIKSGDFTIYDEKDGLCSNVTISMTNDLHGNLWICTPNGLSNFNKTKKIFRNYFTSDGLPTDELNHFILCASNGNIYIGLNNGIAEFNPDSLLGILPPPQTFFSSIEANGEQLKAGDSTIRLSYSQRNVSFEFSTINFIDPDHDQYSYRLVGYDKDWNLAGTRQYAAYTNLPGGDYTFEVRAANIEGVWNDHPTKIFLHIATPYWQRWWFYLIVLLGISGLLYFLYRIRVDRLLSLERMRSRISRDLHDDVGSALSSINIWSEVASNELKRDAQRSEEYLRRIHKSSQSMLDNMSDIIWAINPINDTVDKLLARMKNHAAEMLEPKDIHFEFLVSDAIKKITVPMQYRREWYLIFKEAINNAAKYSEAKNIFIRISYYHRVLILQIKDDGKGFDSDSSLNGNGKGGNGLRNMRDRAANMNAVFQISSSAGNGAEVTLKQRIT